METMYDRLGDLLNETLEAGRVKFVKVPEKENCSDEKEQVVPENEPDIPPPKKFSAPKRLVSEMTEDLERAFRLLDITPFATEEELKKAYKDKLKYFHPDRHQENEILKNVATKKTSMIVDAFNLISSKIQK